MGTGPGQGFREEGVAVQARRQSLAGAYLVQGAPREGLSYRVPGVTLFLKCLQRAFRGVVTNCSD